MKLKIWATLVLIGVGACGQLAAQEEQEALQDISGNYHFLTADDQLGILEQEGKLKGYIDVTQGEEESDAVLSYEIVDGIHTKTHVEFRTNKIHRKYYRFSGTVQRGAGHEDGDPDYMRIVGDLEVITIKGEGGGESVQRVHATFKSKGKSERELE